MEKNKLDQEYKKLVTRVFTEGHQRQRRNGEALGVFGACIEHDMQEGFPILTSKFISIKTVAAELIWFLNGFSSLQKLHDLKCFIWDGDAYRSYKQRGGQLTEAEWKKSPLYHENIGPLYPEIWRGHYSLQPVDQIAETLESLKQDPLGARHIVQTWIPEIVSEMILPPCHYSFQFHREPQAEGPDLLNLQFIMRSVDIGLGLPYNLASYGLLLHLYAYLLQLKPGKLRFIGTECHIYKEHIEGLTEQLARPSYPLPKLEVVTATPDLRELPLQFYQLLDYQSHKTLYLPLIV